MIGSSSSSLVSTLSSFSLLVIVTSSSFPVEDSISSISGFSEGRGSVKAVLSSSLLVVVVNMIMTKSYVERLT
jgi:hypothetical protein